MALNLIRGSLATAKLAPMARLASSSAKFQQALAQNTSDLTQIDSGLTVATEKTGSPAATVGIYVDGGVRHETAELNGITYFLEKLLLRSTKSRNSQKMANDLRALGQAGSFTNRENTGYFITCAPNDAPKALELLTEMIASPSLSAEDIEATRKDILRELEGQEENPEQVVMDYLHRVAYQDTSLAFSKYGPTANIERFTKDDILRGIDSLFKPARLVVAASGDVEHKSLVDIASKSLSGLTNNYETSGIPSFPSTRYTGSDIRVRDDALPACHVAFAIETPGYGSPDSVAFDIATQLHGKWDLTHGGNINTSNYMGMVATADHIAQSFQAFNLLYKETALFGAYFVGERMSLEEVLWQYQYQWKRLVAEVTNNEIAQGKNVLLSKLVNQRENSASNARSLAVDVIRHGSRQTLEDLKSKIDRVDAKKLQGLAEHYIWDRCPVVSAYGPCEALPHYERSA